MNTCSIPLLVHHYRSSSEQKYAALSDTNLAIDPNRNIHSLMPLMTFLLNVVLNFQAPPIHVELSIRQKIYFTPPFPVVTGPMKSINTVCPGSQEYGGCPQYPLGNAFQDLAQILHLATIFLI